MLWARDGKALGRYLTRSWSDAESPRQVRLVVRDGATLEDVTAAVTACREAGVPRVRYSGCIPPGCGIPAGKAGQVRYDDADLEVKNLIRILEENFIKC